MSRLQRWRFIQALFILNSLLYASSVWAQTKVGEALLIQGTAESAEPRTSGTWTRLARRDGIFVPRSLRTAQDSKLEVLLGVGSKFTLGEGVQTDIPDPGGSSITLLVLPPNGGLVRVVTSPPPDHTIITQTATGIYVKAIQTGYIVTCGLPLFADPTECLIVGLYGTTEVTIPGLPPARPLTRQLTRQQYIRVQGINLQTPTLPPPTLGGGVFQDLIDRTTIVGTGTEPDRLEITQRDPLPQLHPLVDSPYRDSRSATTPWERIPDNPPSEFQLPLPPPPPVFP